MAWLFFKLIWLMLPAYLANMSPVIIARHLFPKSKTPMDFGLKFYGKRLLGINKTWRGFLTGIVIAIIVAWLQGLAGLDWLNLYNYSNWLAWGFLLGFGALFGDAVKSFFKRRVGIKPGDRWMPFDQLDFVLGALLFGSIVYFPGWLNALYIVIISVIGHIITAHVAYYLRIRKVKW